MSNGPECKYYGFTVGTVSDSRLPNNEQLYVCEVTSAVAKPGDLYKGTST